MQDPVCQDPAKDLAKWRACIQATFRGAKKNWTFFFRDIFCQVTQNGGFGLVVWHLVGGKGGKWLALICFFFLMATLRVGFFSWKIHIDPNFFVVL